ncbi:metallophosphoesterase [Bradyrhizobium sp. 62]|uniref:metallophosphoesterase n=1 Tax=Bradyrhizobium sp. 62 TaxID=1043588 RepID=UPI001FFBF9A7|nr:metallophosphoesterase [Bradyrhizobium sp. 62]MCK1365179.1 metallophosphoesterase [Bradyrhizobium sp. 62]
MRLWILSDLHLELTQGWDLPSGSDRPEFDVLVIAGDLIPRMERGVRWLAERVPDRPVVYVAGNHEFYGGDERRGVEKAKAAAAGTSVHVLQNETVRIGSVTFAGATLWVDFALLGEQRRAMIVAGDRMNDFRHIRTKRYSQRFRPHHALARHTESRNFLEAELRKERSGPLVIVTHHAPHRAQPDPYQAPPSDLLEAAYRSDLTHLMVPGPDDGRGALRPADLWIYGHTHTSFQDLVGTSLLVSNAKGYGPNVGQTTWDNPRFDPHYVIEI